MSASHLVSRKVLLFVLIAVILLVSRVASPVPARAETPSDGRINLIPWGNGNGEVAVYCTDANGGHNSFTGGGIDVLNSNGQRLLFAPENRIVPAQTQADKTGRNILILTRGVFSLYALPGGFFELDSRADGEGKTFVGKWYGCTPIGPGPDAVPPVLVCVAVNPCQVRGQACVTANGGNPSCVGTDPVAYCNRCT